MAKKILVVDDEADCISFLESILEDEGYEVISATDGEQCIEILKTEKPALTILDVQMPKKDGFQTFYDMRKNEDTKNIPIIMLTGIKDKIGIGYSEKDMSQYLDSKPEKYIEKPVDPEKLVSAIKEILK